jgi:hypothetical protein
MYIRVHETWVGNTIPREKIFELIKFNIGDREQFLECVSDFFMQCESLCLMGLYLVQFLLDIASIKLIGLKSFFIVNF